MQKQKRGFLLFISSLIPGAGEMYMGFFKQGISIMTLFWAIIAIAGGLNISSLVIFLPVLWFTRTSRTSCSPPAICGQNNDGASWRCHR